MEFNKLVRDKIPEIIKSRGDFPFVHTAGETEYEKALEAKLYEEVKELMIKNTNCKRIYLVAQSLESGRITLL